MNNILNDEAKSFKLIRPRLRNGTYKPMITRLKTMMNTVYFNTSTNPVEIFTGLKNLVGENGVKRYFWRYYFPKRFIYNSPFEIKPRQRVIPDPKIKTDFVKNNIKGYSGYVKNKLVDRRNTIIDFTDLLSGIIPYERKVMVKQSVINYILNIWPEIICYILFDNPKHDKSNDIDDEEITEENYIPYELSEEDYSLKIPFEELSDEDWDMLSKMIDEGASTEAFVETLFSKTSVFTVSGPPIGISKFGFDKFIISVPFNLTKYNLIDKQHLNGKIDILRNFKIDPNFAYPFSIVKFIYKCYEALMEGGGDQFVSELIKYDVTFHIYADNGTGFCINLRELKNDLHFSLQRFMSVYINRLKLLSMINLKLITDTDLDKLESDISNSEPGFIADNLDNKNAKHKLKKDMDAVVKQDSIIKNLITNKIKKKEIIVDEFKNGKHVSHNAIEMPEDEEDKIAALVNKASKNVTKIESDDPDEPDIEFDDSDFDAVLEDGEEEDIIEEESEDEEDDSYKYNEEEEETSEEEPETTEETPEEDEGHIEYGEFEDDNEETESENDEDNYYADTGDVDKQKEAKTLKVTSEDTYKAHTGAKDAKRIKMLQEKYKSLDINGTKITDIIGNAANIQINSKKELGTKPPKTADSSVTNMNLANFDTSYVKNNYQADIINAVRSLSVNKEVPLYMTKINVTDVSDQFADKLLYEFTLEDEFKKKHNLKFEVPKLDEKGYITMSGSKAYIKKQLIRKPIVKIGPDKVYITTQLNAYQVFRHGMILNKSSEVVRRLLGQYFVDNPNVKIERGNCENDNTDYLTTLEYDTLAKDFFSITINQDSKFGNHVVIYFSQRIIREKIKQFNIKTGYKDVEIPDNILPLAIDYTTNSLISIDIKANSSVNSSIVTIFNKTLKDENLIEFIKKVKTPKRRVMTKADIQSFKVPLIAVLNYLFTWDRVKSYFPENEIEFSEKRIDKTSKLFIKFYDGYLYYNQYPSAGAMLLNGLVDIDTESYHYADLNNPALYINYTFDKYGTRNIVKGWVTLKESMLDYKTLQILEYMHLPTDLLEIFLYCNELLTDNHCLPESDVNNYRIRSNEIITQCLYQVLNKEYNVYKKRSGKKSTMTVPINAVMTEVYKTDILGFYDALSPIAELRNQGITTFKGPGGTKLEQAFTTVKRSYDKSYFGIFGMSTPDNGNAGIVKELSTNTNIQNTLGFVETKDPKAYNFNDITPIAEAVTPFATRVDDPSRISFLSGQNAHVAGLVESSLPCVRTGIEKVIQFECSDNFVKRAKQDCVINSVDEINKCVYITNKDGTKECIDYKDVILKNSDAFNNGSFNLHVKPGMKLKAGDVIAADSRFFKVDPFTKELVYTQTKNALVGILEGGYTEDDSDAITQEFADEIHVDFTERKQICIKAMDTIIDYKKVGDHVTLGDPIFVFDNSGTFEEEQDGTDTNIIDLLYGEVSADEMAEMIHQVPKAPMTGTIKEMRVYWSCPVEKMSKTAAKFVRSYINNIKKEIAAEEEFTGKESEKRKLIVPINKNNYTSGEPRINGVIIDPEGSILIEYFISSDNSMGTGDKIALNTSLKSVNGYIIPKGQEPYTESGKKLSGLFSFISCEARMINSIWYQWLGTILYMKSKQIAKDFLKEIGEEIPNNPRDIHLGK